MRFFAISLAAALFLLPAFAQEVKVPGIGSVWKSTIKYIPREDGFRRERDDHVEVKEMRDGRPVFSGTISGFQGEIVEVKEGVLFYDNKCRYNVPEELFAPPNTHNQCGASICIAPPVGEKLERKTIVFAPILFCSQQEGKYIFESKYLSTYKGDLVTVGRVTVMLRGDKRGEWDSYVKEGVGEIFAEEAGHMTINYSEIEVPLVPYWPPEDITSKLREFDLAQ